MGSAIGERIKAKYAVWAFDKDNNKTNNLSGINVADNIIDLVNKANTIILAVKPQDFDAVLNDVKNYVKDKLIISIAAGINTGYIENNLSQAHVVRAMPNIGAKIGEAETSLCGGKSAFQDDLIQAKELFDQIGNTWEIPEKMIDAATAICGSGPAYIFYDMEENHIDPNNIPKEVENRYIKNLEIAAKELGFDDPATALMLATATTGTSIHLVRTTGLSPKELREQVTSRGGTTEAALKVLFVGGNWADAAKAALKRAKELSRG